MTSNEYGTTGYFTLLKVHNIGVMNKMDNILSDKFTRGKYIFKCLVKYNIS